MKSYTASALGIAFKIWIIALIINTTVDTILLNHSSEGFVEIFLLIGLFGGLFSAPIFLIIWAIVYSLLKSGKNAEFIFKWLLIVGVGLAIAAWGVFTGSFRFLDSEIMSLIVVSPISGAVAISISYPNIKKACFARDEDKMLLENFDAEHVAAK